MPYAHDLRQDGAAAAAKDAVVLVAFVADHCPYCKTVLNEFLLPMSRNADYDKKVLMRRIETREDGRIRDFDGKLVSQRQFAAAYGVQMVPTIMLFDRKGRALGKPLVGVTTVDYYGYYLDEAIDAALVKVKGAP